MTADAPVTRADAKPLRADAQKNHDHLLATARGIVLDRGAQASLRDIARQAGVGLGTLYRHFPTREALLEALLRADFDALARRAETLAQEPDAARALVTWLREAVAVTHGFSGAIALMVACMPPAPPCVRRERGCCDGRSRTARRAPTWTATTCSR